MSIQYKKLSTEELDKFIEIRIHQLREEGAKEDIDIRPALYDYYHRHMAEKLFFNYYISYISSSNTSKNFSAAFENT